MRTSARVAGASEKLVCICAFICVKSSCLRMRIPSDILCYITFKGISL